MTDRPVLQPTDEEIEITPEMLEAGYDALFENPRYPEIGKQETLEVLTLAFFAMLRARRKGPAVPASPDPVAV
jgi:hypothetical protein